MTGTVSGAASPAAYAAWIDLEDQAASSRREVGIKTYTYLMAIFRRLPPLDPVALPDADQLAGLGTGTIGRPDTPQRSTPDQLCCPLVPQRPMLRVITS